MTVDEQFRHDIINELSRRGIMYKDTRFGIGFDTGVDSWIVNIYNVSGEHVTYAIYHKNNLLHYINGSKKRKGDTVPGYHLQRISEYSIASVVGYCCNHNKKWEAKR